MRSVLGVFLRRLLCRNRFEREIAEELQFHLDARIVDLEQRGLDHEEACRRARIEFGGIEQYKEHLRADRPGATLDILLQDIRLSVRELCRKPTFALAVALTLSLGIGASTAVFGILRTTFLSRIPYSAPDRLVVGRTTSFAFKGKDEDMRVIGRKLGVDAILAGSVRKAGNQLRITAQLANVEDGYHLWSRRYDREMTDLLSIQEEIAQRIAATLKDTLNPKESVALVRIPATGLLQERDSLGRLTLQRQF